ncbi:DNA repair protein RecN [soil metagenome]
MLTNLLIRDFVIVEAVELEFGAGFTVFSGETGAGKSILIDALAIALGGKGDAAMVRQGAPRADITATFRTDAALEAWLHERELQADSGSVILRRTVDAEGRSKGYVNGVPTSLATLRECGDRLVEIHGQHAHQQLLKPAAQRQLLDAHAGLLPQVAEVGIAFQTWQTAVRERAALEADSQAAAAERDRLEWQAGELDRLAPHAGEWADISGEHRRLAHAAALIDGVRQLVARLGDDDGAAIERIDQSTARLRALAEIDPALADPLAALDSAEAALADAVSTLNHYLTRLDVDPARLGQLDARMTALHSAARKFRVEPEGLVELLEQTRSKLALLEAGQDQERLAAREREAEQRYRAKAVLLTQGRRDAAASLAREVTRAMQDLAMSGGQLSVRVTERATPSAYGLDHIEFDVAGHAGVEPRPLAKVASGGELARISLAIAVIAASATATPTLIFDAVESGIGGRVAEIVGVLLRRLGESRQVFCVTHLPQVAAQGQQHYVVAKHASATATRSEAVPVREAGRVDEIARMLGGVEITAATRKAAREMLARR